MYANPFVNMLNYLPSFCIYPHSGRGGGAVRRGVPDRARRRPLAHLPHRADRRRADRHALPPPPACGRREAAAGAGAGAARGAEAAEQLQREQQQRQQRRGRLRQRRGEEEHHQVHIEHI